MARRKITQQVFDDAVKDNQDELEMELAEAIEDAKVQFELQGIDLSNIDTSEAHFSADSGGHPALVLVENLKSVLASGKVTELSELLKSLSEIMITDDTARPLLAQKDAFPVLLECCEVTASHAKDEKMETNEGLHQALECLSILLDGQPDLVSPPQPDEMMPVIKDNVAVKQLCRHVSDFRQDSMVQQHGIKSIKHACVMHETNRQTFIAEGLVELLLAAVETHESDPKAVKEASHCLRVLTFDDDVRVAFGKAHEHAKLIVDQHSGFSKLIPALEKFVHTDVATTSDLLQTLSRLAVRNEYCKQLVSLGVMQIIMSAFEEYPDSTSVNKACFNLIKALAGNDDVKTEMGQNNGILMLISAMDRHIKSSIVGTGCAAVAALCLRHPSNCTLVNEAQGPNLFSKIFTIHMKNDKVIKSACRAVRNLVVRNPELRPIVLEENMEALLNQALKTHERCQDDAKAALRDLGCKVELLERWKGTSPNVTN